ncbi:Hypothetical predicted protein, partial [Paramuricea clavata]
TLDYISFMDQEGSHGLASTEAPDQAITEASRKQPEAPKPDIQEALANIDTTMGKMADLFEILIAEKANKPLQGERPTGKKRTAAEREDDTAGGDESESETSSFRSRGKRQRREQSPDAISIHAGESEDDLAQLLGSSEKERENEPDTEAEHLLNDLAKGLSDDESTGPNISQKLADIALKRWGKQLNPEKLKSILEKYTRPENCPALQTTNMLVETPNRDNSQLLASLVDTEYSAICSLEDQPNSKLLFGNDLAKNLKDAKEASSLSSSMKRPTQEQSKEKTLEGGTREEVTELLKQIRNSVSEFEKYIPVILTYLQNLCTSFKAGRVAEHFTAWTKITQDSEILSNITGVVIECTETPVQLNLPGQKFHPHEYQILDAEISKLVGKGVVNKVQPETTQFISSIFLRPKPDGSHRLILNLKKFNETVVYHHFKMDSIYDITKLVTKDCFMASLDLKDAYYSIPIKASDRKYLRFIWKKEIYQFTCLPNGLSCAPRVFTKILKPALATLHSMGHISVAHIDDCYLQGQTYDKCVVNVLDTFMLLDNLGFVIHPIKSILKPSQQIITLGFLINSLTMTIRLTSDKAIDLKKACKALRTASKPQTIREVARIIGKIVASFPGVMYGPLYYRELDKDKTQALKEAKGDFDATMALSQGAKTELHWWECHVENSFQKLTHEEPQHKITTDASLSGWGAEYQDISTGGMWIKSEATNHINYLEMLAIFLGLQTFAKNLNNTHIRMCDNTTAVNVINHMGTSHSDICNNMAKQIWEWCIDKNIWLTVAHIPGKQNLVADYESRRHQRESEWMLNKALLSDTLIKLNFSPEIDLFATRVNKQFPKYVAYRPDPNACAIDAFTLSWANLKFYAFPPFSVIGAMLAKIQKEGGQEYVCCRTGQPRAGMQKRFT